MKPSSPFFSILLFGLLFAACTGVKSPQPTTELPQKTSTVFTPTPEPSPTPTPTPTPIPLPPVFVREGSPPIQPVEPITVDNASRIQELARWGYGAINEVEHSKDGQYMFVQTSMGVYAYHAGALDEVWRYVVDDGASAFDVGSQYLAVGTYRGEIILLDAADGSEVNAWEAHNESILDVALSPDETMVVSGSYDEIMKLWQVGVVSEVSLLYQIEMLERVEWVSFADSGSLVIGCKNHVNMCSMIETDGGKVVRYIDGLIFPEYNIYISEEKIRRISTNELILEADFFELDGESFWPASCAISNNGYFFAVGGAGDDFDILLWDLEEGLLLKKIKVTPIISLSTGHLARPALRSGPGPYGISSLDFSPDDRYLLAANGFGNIYIWDFQTGAVRTITKSGYRNVIFSPDGKRVISYNDGEIAVFDLMSGERLYSTSEGWYGVNDYMEYDKPEIFFSPDGTKLANGSRVWILDKGERMQMPIGERALGFSKDGHFVYTIQRQWKVIHRRFDDLSVYKVTSLENPIIVDGIEYYSIFPWWEMYGWEITSDENHIQAVAYDTPYFMWDINSGELVYPDGMDYWKRSYYSSDGRFHVEGIARDSILVSEKQADGSYQEIYTIDHWGRFFFYSVHVLMLSAKDSLKFYDLIDKNQIDSFDMSDYSSSSNWVLSPDGSLLAVSNWKEVHIWDLKRDVLLAELDAFLGDIRDLTFSPDGRYLATTSWDGTVRLWGIVP
jgi:WD40 repeat protein